MTSNLRTPFSTRMTHLDAYPGDASEAAFLLGGIGTGNVSIGARGELRDWELFNRPGKKNRFPYTFFAIHTSQNGSAVNRVLEGPIKPPYSNSHGFYSADVGGLPRMRSSKLRGEYPLCMVEFEDSTLPVSVTMESYTPFIPLNPEDSGIPAAIIRYRVKNTSKAPVFVAVAGSLANMTTFNGYGDFDYVIYEGETRNELRDGGVYMRSLDFPQTHPMNSSMAITTTNPDYTRKTEMYMGPWWDGIQDYWDDFREDGKLESESNVTGTTDTKILDLSRQRIGAVAPNATIASGEEYVFEFIISWHFPNRPRKWNCDYDPKDENLVTIRNHYALKFEDAWAVFEYVRDNMPRLEEYTMKFHEALFESTLPKGVLEAVSCNITVLRSPTCFWLENGYFLGWEGCFDKGGSCSGSCTHVWNYAQTLAFLFPSLERTMRENEFLNELCDDGKMNFRAHTMLEGKAWEMYPATDGQTGTIVRLYRDWKLSGDNKFIEKLAQPALRALDFSIRHWDSDGDGVLDSQQHNTYDIEFYGISSMSNTMFFAALKAGAEIAKHIGDTARSESYMALYESGSKKLDETFNGEYYPQQIDDVNKYKYQYGSGCLSDQIVGQYMAHVAGLGYILPEEHVKKAAKAIHKYNLKTDLHTHENVQRTYALEDEKGLLLCTWPHGGRPKFPFVYSDEVWTGIEYQVAATLFYHGDVEEGLEIVNAVRKRHDGYRRNPFNEVECGHHYARSMASWALLTALSGFEYDMVAGTVKFCPKIDHDNFQTFFSTGKCWGIYKEKFNDAGENISETQIIYKA